MCYGHQIKTLANIIPSTQTWTIIEAIMMHFPFFDCMCSPLIPYVLVIIGFFSFAIRLYVKLCKEKLELHVELDAIE
jgi:uncharacterized membrane-anchored protein